MSQVKYPLISQLKLSVNKHTPQYDYASNLGVIGRDFTSDWILAEDLEKVLYNAPVVWKCDGKDIQTLHLAQPCDATHTARLLAITLLKTESSERALLREFLSIYTDARHGTIQSLKERARELLDKESET